MMKITGADAEVDALQEKLKGLSGEKLKRAEKMADQLLGFELDRLQIQDAGFRKALFQTIAIEQEKERRKNT